MNRVFYPKLAWMGIAKNRKTSLPYLLTCVGMVMMFYIVAYLTQCELIQTLRGAEYAALMLRLGMGIIGAFSLIFLFYTNSFLVRRRKKEFGLYNILGMGKWNLARILGWEALMMAVLSLGLGLVCGILFSKLAELGMANLLSGDITFTFAVDPDAVVKTVALYAVIFFLILLNTLRQIHVSKPVELLRSESVGEKPPRTNWVLALLGAGILGGAYYLAVTIQNPLSVLLLFFVAVFMVIIATYLLFIAGSVAVCRLLQRNKRYYYRTNHFVSVSSMVYRMKRNGAGLASICILSTMILVMLSSTVCLYIGAEDAVRSRYPREVIVEAAYGEETPDLQAVRDVVARVLAEARMQPQNVLDYRYATVSAVFRENRAALDSEGLSLNVSGQARQILFVPLEAYNALADAPETLDAGEILVYSAKGDYPYDTLALEDFEVLRVKKRVPEFVTNGMDSAQMASSIFVVVPNYEEMVRLVNGRLASLGNERTYRHDYYAFDLGVSEERQIFIRDEIAKGMREILDTDARFARIVVESRVMEHVNFNAIYGGFLFLGVLLGIVFLFATVLIMYYKQVTEGYEDESRFDIMQKVGMTPQEIKRSVNSQVLTVFFLPLVAAGLHVAFAFPMIAKMLMLFGLTNLRLFVLVTLVCFLIFALFYVLVYRITSYAYLTIISGKKRWA